MHFDEKILKFYRGLTIADPLPPRVEVMNPYASKEAMRLCREFYGRFYRDDIRRYLIVGINPGRYGAGLTGIPFTDPVKLEQRFGIANSFPKKNRIIRRLYLCHDRCLWRGREVLWKILYQFNLSPRVRHGREEPQLL